MTKSLDGGVTFSAPKSAVLFTQIASTLTGGNGVQAASFPATAVDKNGTYHLVYAAVSSGQTVDRSDIFYVRSTDGGATFSAPRAPQRRRDRDDPVVARHRRHRRTGGSP